MAQLPYRADAWVLQGDFAFLPAVPLSPHAHVVGSLTAKPAQQLPAALLALCDASRQQGVVYISTGVTAVPGKPWPSMIAPAWVGLPNGTATLHHCILNERAC